MNPTQLYRKNALQSPGALVQQTRNSRKWLHTAIIKPIRSEVHPSRGPEMCKTCAQLEFVMSLWFMEGLAALCMYNCGPLFECGLPE